MELERVDCGWSCGSRCGSEAVDGVVGRGGGRSEVLEASLLSQLRELLVELGLRRLEVALDMVVLWCSGAR